MSIQIEASWKEQLKSEFTKSYFEQLVVFLKMEKAQARKIYPPGSLIFNAFEKTPFNKVKAVILGQDPYHGAGQAHGLCFSVPDGVAPPPSLENIFKELQTDIGLSRPSNGNLSKWSEQGVLLLNSSLTVRAGEAGSHARCGWMNFTDAVIRKLSDEKKGIVFILWGKFAQEKQLLIDATKHHILKAAHPSPLSAYAGFFGCKHFSITNEILVKQGLSPIDWSL